VFSVAVFKPFRGQGIARFMYTALDHILKKGLPISEDKILYFTSMHIGCSAPELQGKGQMTPELWEDHLRCLDGAVSVANYFEGVIL
jgi:hypothetical protein